jgi:HlyD family secretion protein
LGRAERLYRAEAATARQLAAAAGEVRVIEARMAGARQARGGAHATSEGVEAGVRLLDDQIARSRIINPVGGTVLTTYVAAGESVHPGQPLYRIAELSELTLRAYVSAAQLSSVRVGADVAVRVDAGAGELRALPGTVAWIAERAEFTPTPIQTRDERVHQVYAVRIRVANADGTLRIGMPGEVIFGAVTP